MDAEKLVIKKRDGEGSKIITVRIKASTLEKLDAVAGNTNHSRNELINRILLHGLENLKIED